MLTPKLKQDVQRLWDMFWSGGMTNPLTAIEQITYLIFLKRLSEKVDVERKDQERPSLFGPRPNCELEHHPADSVGFDDRPPVEVDTPRFESCRGHATCKWSYIRDLSNFTSAETQQTIGPYEHMNRYVFPWLRVLHTTLLSTNHATAGDNSVLNAPMEDAFFQFPKEKTEMFKRAVKQVDNLFKNVGQHDESDLMGDIFEFLLSEIQTSGKNGQFRTPRHIIRFMNELIEPELGMKILDPTAGTGGFLIDSLQYLRKQWTSKEISLLEWNGTPHRLVRDLVVTEEDEDIWRKGLDGSNFVGYDNDRTMVRIGWMNMILHGIENPAFSLRDTLSKSMPIEGESNSYDRILANPPYTGTIDKNDLNNNSSRFPRNPKKISEPITNKTELLFTWLILDLLQAGGLAAIIVPEGVLFGSTGAHKELRRQLLFQHELHGVISLPPGVFNPYTGVKTSILVFKKGGGGIEEGMEIQGQPPRTEKVWFYDVASDGYSLGAKRDPDYTPHNDLWDALAKWPERVTDSLAYYQPIIFKARWRRIDENILRIFPELRHGWEPGTEWGIHELFSNQFFTGDLYGLEPTPDPDLITKRIGEVQRPRILRLFQLRLETTEAQLKTKINNGRSKRNPFELNLHDLEQLFNRKMDEMLENNRGEYKNNPTHARDALKPCIAEALTGALEQMEEHEKRVANANNIGIFAQGEKVSDDTVDVDWEKQVEHIVREFARIDGNNIMLRTKDVSSIDTEPREGSKSWSASVRVLRESPDWRDGLGSHDKQGLVRPEYLADPSIYEDRLGNTIKKDYLDPNCIEAKDCDLSVGRYRPFKPSTVQHDPPAKLIRELQELEGQIMTRLDNLLDMVEDRK
jgi:type I restriction enzyme M protein